MTLKNPNIKVLGEYKGDKIKIKVLCKVCGYEWEDSPTHLKLGRGCTMCKKAIKLKLLELDFINRSNNIHNNKYDYSKVNYINQHTKVIITCPIHGDFEQIPNSHLRGRGCPKCSHPSKAYSTQEFIEKANKVHNNKYDYSNIVYINNDSLIKIICPKHGEFLLKPHKHLAGHGCTKCAIENGHSPIKKTLEQFIRNARKVHGDKYNYSKFNYVNKLTKGIIICPKHGEFEQTPDNHLLGHGCPKCQLKSQTKLYEKLKESFPNEEILFEVGNNTIGWINGQRFDIYFPKYNIAVEYNGKLHYIPIEHFGGKLGFLDTLKRDELKRQKCKENNCTLFEVKYDYTEQEYQTLVNKIQNIINNY